MGVRRTRWPARGLKGFTRLCIAVVALSAASAQAHGQDRITARAAADALFDQGRVLMAQGRYEEACTKFAESQRLDAGVGTLLNLAECLERTGRTASAWLEFRSAAAAARNAGQVDRERMAKERAAMLKPRLAMLTIALAPGNTAPGIQIRRDGEVLDPSVWGTPLPVDPGIRTVEVSARGKKTWTASIEIPAKPGATATMTVPILEDDPAQAGGGREMQRTAAFITGGAGAIGVALGAAFGIVAIVKNDESQSYCRTRVCTEKGVTLRSEARAAATGSTVAFAMGAAALAGGAVLYLTSRRPGPPAPELHLSIAPAGRFGSGVGLVAGGSF